MNGAIRRFNVRCAPRSCWRSIRLAKRSLKRASVPSRPGLQARITDHSSPSRFSIGVPDIASRNVACSANTAWLRLAAAFLIACASSSTSVAQIFCANASPSICSIGYETSSTSCLPISPMTLARSLVLPRSAYTCTRRDGAKRDASARQLPISDVGITTSVGPFAARASITASACSVLPRPMSSARQAPRPADASRIAHSKPSSWYGRSCACSVDGSAGTMRRASSSAIRRAA